MSHRLPPRSVIVLTCVAALAALAACDDGTSTPPERLNGAGLAIHMGPLAYPGVADACYSFAVVDAAGAVVVARGAAESLTDPARNPASLGWTNGAAVDATPLICASQYGSGPSGGWSFVAPCDASAADRTHTVTIWLDALHVSGVEEALSAGVDYQDPCPSGCRATATCDANADVGVSFDLTVMRTAQQGFFDLAVGFEDVFCSAKVDCVDGAGAPLELLHVPGSGARGQTAVVALSCTAGPGGGPTVMLRDPVTVTCGSGAIALDPAAGHGNIYGVVMDDPDPAGAVWQYAVHAGSEDSPCGAGTCARTWWNVSVGFDPGAEGCVLEAVATAGPASALIGYDTPEGTTWPLVEAEVTLTGPTGGLACGSHPLHGELSGVGTRYTGLDAPRAFAYRYDGALSCGEACTPAEPEHPTIQASGGVVTEYVGDGDNGELGVTYRVHTFTAVGTSAFTVAAADPGAAVEYLIVGGGGGGGGRHGAGGGAGGLLTNVGVDPLPVSAQTYTVAVGGGGVGGPAGGGGGASGANSSFAGLVALGGGGGGAHDGGTPGKDGGSGGGGAATHGRGLGAPGQGHHGGFGVGDPNWNHGGGGGAGGLGVSGTTTTQGDGGPGLLSAITGAPVYYAGGGGGGGHNIAATKRGFGGIGGGGDSGLPGTQSPGQPGVNGLGGGGGGAATTSGGSSSTYGGVGGSGLVIIRYPL